MDFKECGACAVTIMLGAYEATKLLRLARILNSHHDLVKVLDRVDKTLAELAGVKPIGFPYKLLDADTRKQFFSSSNGNTHILEEQTDRHLVRLRLSFVLGPVHLFSLWNEASYPNPSSFLLYLVPDAFVQSLRR